MLKAARVAGRLFAMLTKFHNQTRLLRTGRRESKMKKIVAALMLLNSPAFAKDPYFSDLVKRPEVRKNWSKIISGHKFRKEDGWIIRHDGLRGPLETISINSEQFFKDDGCQPHDCLDNSIVILVNKRTRQIWMVHRKITFPSRNVSYIYFGEPSDPMKSKLKSLLSKI